MFIDEVKAKISSGRGGDGIVAFRREKYVPMGGPAGGDGGRGGNIVFIGDENLSTLMHLRYNKKITAKNGENGRPKRMDGAGGIDKYINVPLGTIVYDDTTDEIIADITKQDQEYMVCKGGRGGRGNVKFATSKVPAPEICEKGEPGFEISVRIELKVLADVGLVGFPSVGKSTIISTVSACRPKIASYHFTTLQPNLGVIDVGDDRSFVMADLPGLIEGASLGAGLGYQFLKHIERTRVIIHVIDMSGSEGRDPYDDYCKINNELETYKYNLLKRPQIIAANKMDLPDSSDNLGLFKELVPDVVIVPISAITKEGIKELIYKTADILETVKDIDFNYDDANEDSIVEYNFEPEDDNFIVIKSDDGVYEVRGERLYKVFEMTDFTKHQAVKRFSRQLRQLGIDEALRSKGVKNGDIVRIFEYEFEFID